jgi:hypothetical protein
MVGAASAQSTGGSGGTLRGNYISFSHKRFAIHLFSLSNAPFLFQCRATGYYGPDSAPLMNARIFGQSLVLAASVVTTTGVAHAATITVDFTGQTGTAASRSFSGGGLTLDFAYSADSPQAFVASSEQGLCLFANSTDGVPRCGVTGTVTEPQTYNFIKMTPSKNVYFTGADLKQIILGAQGVVSPVAIFDSLGGSIIGSIRETPTGQYLFDSPILLSASQPIFFGATGLNSSLRYSKFTFEDVPTPPPSDVPSPLPIFGASVAFGWSRTLRKRIASRS